jgi:alkylation response protein AidB-like acyl-CoA dehydrogenase
MDLSYTPPYESYRNELRNFIASCWNPGNAKGAGRTAYIAEFRRAAVERGYLYRNIPKQYGGSGEEPDVLKATIIRSEFGRAHAPMEVPGNGVSLLVPTLLDCGTAEQKQLFIPKTISGEYLWAQGYSEPGAGSDLASLRTRATLERGEWIINGHKIWTTLAQTAHYIFALVRTEPDLPRHAGISYLLVPVDQRGVEIRPLRQITGGREFCEVFFDDARAPAEWLIGKRGEGWRVSRSTLKHERNMVGAAETVEDLFGKLRTLAQRTERNGAPLIKDPLIRDRMAAIDGYLKAHLYSSYHQLTRAARGEAPGLPALLNKLNGTNITQEIAKLATEIIGSHAMLVPEDGVSAGPERWMNQIFGSIALGIAGGTSNIQRNIIAERGLGLPREPSAN